jgi:parallel beta-helix repeat protein
MLLLERKVVSAITLILLLAGTLTLAFNIRAVKAGGGTVYIRADGSIDPPTAPILTVDNATYTLTGNITSGADGIVIERDNTIVDAAGYTIQGTGAYPYKGIDLSGRSNVTIRSMEIDTFSYGIWLDSSDYNSVIGNNITGNSYFGIQLYYSSSNSIVGNNVTITTGWGYGIGLNYSSSNTISGNNIGNHYHYCIGLFFSSDYNIISGNNIINNGSNGADGILSDSSDYNSVIGNNITGNNDHGIWLRGSSSNTISGNNVTANHVGIVLSGSSDNRVYHNNFIDNSQQVIVYYSGFANVWDDGYPLGGNYWSDYNGIDLYSGPYQNETGSDGIGDVPYVIDGVNIDRYPLVSAVRLLRGDLNFDGSVDIYDAIILAGAFNSIPGSPNWNPNADINGDNIVDIYDAIMLAGHFNQHSP